MSAAGQSRSAAPDWLDPLVSAVADIVPEPQSPFAPPADGSGRSSAVLMLFAGNDIGDADLLLLRRASTLRDHAGQVAFPGGGTEAGDSSPAATALREATEEVGVRPDSVEVLAELPALFLRVSSFVVAPVLAFWREPHPVTVVDPGEVSAVARVRLADLVDPAHRFTWVHPAGHRGPGFAAEGLYIWGFTAGLIDRLLRLGGWEQPWDVGVERPVPA